MHSLFQRTITTSTSERKKTNVIDRKKLSFCLFMLLLVVISIYIVNNMSVISLYYILNCLFVIYIWMILFFIVLSKCVKYGI